MDLFVINCTNCTVDQQTYNETIKIGKLIVVGVYGCLTIGLLFNCSVIVTVLNVFRKLKRQRSNNKHTFVYILTLSFVDALVLMNLPFIITDLMTGWVFGTVLCKIHSTLDSVNRVLSTFVLTALSFDRYLVVCYPQRFAVWRRVRVTVALLIACIVLAAVLLSPFYLFTEAKPVPVPGRNISVVKCQYMLENSSHARNHLYLIFGLGYCTPLILMTFFYSNIVIQMWKSSRRSGRQKRSYTRKVTQRTSMLVVFYFCCWTPYWVIQFYVAESETVVSWTPQLFISAYILVYFNSAVNPLLYALLNRELRRQCFMGKNKKFRSSEGNGVEMHNSEPKSGYLMKQDTVDCL